MSILHSKIFMESPPTEKEGEDFQQFKTRIYSPGREAAYRAAV